MSVLTVSGESYHKCKGRFKKMLKEEGINWTGTLESPEWKSTSVLIKAEFIRDEESDKTVLAKFNVTGSGESYGKVVRFIKSEMGANSDIKKEFDSRMHDFHMFEVFFRPNIHVLRVKNTPEAVIQQEMKKYNQKKRKKMLELGVDNGMLKGRMPLELPEPIPLSVLEKEEITIDFSDDHKEWVEKCQERSKKNTVIDSDKITEKITGKRTKSSKSKAKSNARASLRSKLKRR